MGLRTSVARDCLVEHSKLVDTLLGYDEDPEINQKVQIPREKDKTCSKYESLVGFLEEEISRREMFKEQARWNDECVNDLRRRDLSSFGNTTGSVYSV